MVGGFRGVLGDPLVGRFVEVVGAPNRRENNLSYMALKSLAFMCRVSGLGPSELVERLRDDGCEELWTSFLLELKRGGRTGATATGYITGIRAFLEFARVKVDWDYVNRLKRMVYGRGVTRNLFAEREAELTREDVRRLLVEGCRSMRDRAMVMVMATSGISLGDLIRLRVRDLWSIWEDGRPCYMIRYRRAKTGTKATTFITPETRELLLRYLRERGAGPDDPLIAKARGGGPIKDTKAQQIVRAIFARAGYTEEIGRDARGHVRYKYHSHLFRKFFRTALRNAGIERIYVEAMMGHDIRSIFGVEMVYDKQADKPEVLEEHYVKAVPELTFLKEPETRSKAEEDRLRRLEERLMELEAKLRAALTLLEI